MFRRYFLVAAAVCLLPPLGTSVGTAQQRLVPQGKEFTPAADSKPYTRTEDVIYGRKDGVALTMDVFKPKKANGAAIIEIVSGGYFSSHGAISVGIIDVFLKRGYTVFCVVHGSQPRYQVPEIFQDIQRASRFIHLHAKEYGIDPNRIGVTGASAGGNLSLLLATAGTKGNPDASDPVEKQSSRVQAAACFFPPTDFLNYGGPGVERIKFTDFDPRFRASFDYRERNPKTNTYERVTDPEKLKAISRGISPIYFITRRYAADIDYARRQGCAGAPATIGDHGRKAQSCGRAGGADRQKRWQSWLGRDPQRRRQIRRLVRSLHREARQLGRHSWQTFSQGRHATSAAWWLNSRS